MLKLVYYGQNDGLHGPDVNLTGDPGTDNTTLLNAGYLGGKIMASKTSTVASRGSVLVPCDAATMLPYGPLLNGPGEFAGAIGPSGSGKMSVVRAMPTIMVDSQAYVASPTIPYAVGLPIYCGSGATAGLWTTDAPANGSVGIASIGSIIAIPTATSPWLVIAQKL